MTDLAIGGFVSPGFAGVAAEFERNFAERGEVGAAFAVVVDGELVADLWGGWADARERRPWGPDTLQVIFSGTKGLVAVCVLLCIQRGVLDLEQSVCRYWPEFGKESIRVRDVVSHTARLPGVETPVAFDELLDSPRMAAHLAGQAQSTDPRAKFCYHALTYGWLCGELVRRVDGRSIGRFFTDEVADPLGLELWIGLPSTLEDRVSTIELADHWPATAPVDERAFERDPLLRSIWGNPPTFARESFAWNDAAYHAAEIPGVGGIGTARDVARLYAGLDRLLTTETLGVATTTLSEGCDEAHGVQRRFGVGFALQSEGSSLGPPNDAFGHGGAGGSIHGAWPSRRVGFSYAMNLMRDDEPADPRAEALLTALDRALPETATRSKRSS
jgi:CubicO group peptidase (beta-lactamase class C family)